MVRRSFRYRPTAQMKQKFWNFIDTYVAWGAGVLGILLSVYCVLLQTELFKYVGVPLCILSWVAGLGAGYAIIKYFQGVAEKSPELRPVTSKDFKSTVRGSVFLLGVAALLGFTSTEIVWFLVGAAGMMFAGTTLIYFKIWEIKERKEKETPSEDAE